MSESKKKILLVDDDFVSIEAAKIVLQEDYAVTAVQSGQAALDLLTHNYKPDLILLDIIMPEMSGWETFNRIRGISRLQKVPIIFLTSLVPFEGFAQSQEKGAVDYIIKPFDNFDLLERVSKLV